MLPEFVETFFECLELTSPPASDGTRLMCVLELSAGERGAPLVRPCAGRLGQDAPAAERHPSIERYSKSCRAWPGTATENRAPLNAARRRMIRIDGGRSGTARPFPPWRLRSGPCATPIDPKYSGAVFRSCPPGPEHLNAQHPAVSSVPPAPRLSVSPIHIA